MYMPAILHVGAYFGLRKYFLSSRFIWDVRDVFLLSVLRALQKNPGNHYICLATSVGIRFAPTSGTSAKVLYVAEPGDV
jgi:hypothetical protein